MLDNTLTLTVDTTPVSLPRISMGDMTGRFRSADGGYVLNVSHTAGKRERSVVRVDAHKVSTDPYNSALTRPYGMSAYLVVDAPLNGVGFSDAEQEDIVVALCDLVTGPGFLVKFLGKEA